MAKVVAINISREKGKIKEPIEQGVFIEDFGLKDDAHAGKWHRQVSLLANESIDIMRNKSNIELDAGMFAENITTIGIKLHELPVGTKLKIGETLQEVTQIGKECHDGCEIQKKFGSCIMPTQGIFTRILKGGIIKAEDSIEVVESV